MTGLHKNVEEMLVRLVENSRTELDLVRSLADAIRRVDDQVLREVRAVTLQHEIRREAILGELQNLASRMCVLPARPAQAAPRATIDQQRQNHAQQAIDMAQANGSGGDWRQATQNIHDTHDEFDFDDPHQPTH